MALGAQPERGVECGPGLSDHLVPRPARPASGPGAAGRMSSARRCSQHTAGVGPGGAGWPAGGGGGACNRLLWMRGRRLRATSPLRHCCRRWHLGTSGRHKEPPPSLAPNPSAGTRQVLANRPLKQTFRAFLLAPHSAPNKPAAASQAPAWNECPTCPGHPMPRVQCPPVPASSSFFLCAFSAGPAPPRHLTRDVRDA